MWKLIITDDQGQHTVVNLVRDEYRIGRSEENPIRLTERNISRQHAILKKVGTTFSIRDLSSSNGLFVNGVRITGQQVLGHRDLVQLGDYRVEVIDETLDTQEQGHHPFPGPPAAQATRLPDRLVVLIGPNQGAEYAMEGDRYLLGRDEDCDFRIDHGSVSRIHAEVRRLDEDHFEIIDKGSANGLRINGHERPRAVLDGRDVVELGDVVLKYIMKGQVFRVDAAEGERIAAMSGASLPPPEAEARLPLGAPLAAALAGALVIFAVLFWLFRDPTDEATAATDPPALTRAIARLEDGDVFAAHRELTPLAHRIDLYSSPAFIRVESAWATTMMKAAEGEADVASKREIFNEIAQCTTLPAALRQAAVDELDALKASEQATEKPPQEDVAALNADNPITAPPGQGSEPATAETDVSLEDLEEERALPPSSGRQ